MSNSNQKYSVDITVSSDQLSRFIPYVQRAICVALREEEVPEGHSVSILLTDDDQIAKLHLEHMGIEGPTDVMSWPASDFERENFHFLGDIAVSCETAEAQARDQGHPVETEVSVLAVHGLLHLLGWDDQTPQEREEMQKRVDYIVSKALSTFTNSDNLSSST